MSQSTSPSASARPIDQAIRDGHPSVRPQGGASAESVPTSVIIVDPVDDAIVRIVGVSDSNYENDAPGSPEDEVPGSAGGDVAVWLDGRVRAVVRRGACGKPGVIRFDAPEPDQAGGASDDGR